MAQIFTAHPSLLGLLLAQVERSWLPPPTSRHVFLCVWLGILEEGEAHTLRQGMVDTGAGEDSWKKLDAVIIQLRLEC